MKKFFIAAIAVGAATWMAGANAEPTRMTDPQLNAVTAAGFTVKVSNTAIAGNIISASGGSASAQCGAFCAAVNVPVQSGNVSTYYISQTAIAKAGNH